MFFGMGEKDQYNYKEITIIAMVEVSSLLLCVQAAPSFIAIKG